jgi:CRISPR-associated protein Cas5d
MTPSAARGLLESIHWKPAIRWVIDRIHILNEIRFDTIRRNELENKISPRLVQAAMKTGAGPLSQVITEERQQRSTLLLRQVAYIIEAHFVLTDQASEADSPEKHINMFLRRARMGQTFHRPYLGCREFAANYTLIEPADTYPQSYYHHIPFKDLGWMLWDLDYKDEMKPQFFHAVMRNGIVEVPDLRR